MEQTTTEPKKEEAQTTETTEPKKEEEQGTQTTEPKVEETVAQPPEPKKEEEKVTFTFNKGQPIEVLKSALQGSSEVFVALCFGNFKEATSNTVPIPNIKRKIFRLLLDLVQNNKDSSEK